MNIFQSIIKIFVVFVIIIINSTSVLSAQQDNETFWNSVRFGGSFGLNFGNGFFSGTLAPSAIYEFNRHLALGVGLNGSYNSQKNVFNSTILGGSFIGLINPINEIQLSAEYEQLHVNQRFNEGFKDVFWVPALYIGAGFRNGNATFGVRYDLLFNEGRSVNFDALVPFVRFYF